MLEKSHSTTTQQLEDLGEYRNSAQINKQCRSPEVFQKMPDHQPCPREYTLQYRVDTSRNKQIEESSNICQKKNFNISQFVGGFSRHGEYSLQRK